MKVAPPPLPVVRTHGCRIVLADGRELIDGDRVVVERLPRVQPPVYPRGGRRQLATMPHVMFGGPGARTGPQAGDAADGMAPPGLTRVFFADSGSVAVEVALKIALQYWLNKSASPGRVDFLCFSSGYHGDTFGAMAVSDPHSRCTRHFARSAPQFRRGYPAGWAVARELDSAARPAVRTSCGDDRRAAGPRGGGDAVPYAESLAGLYRLAKKHDILFIADEIATGFWRTGNAFA